MSKAPIVRPASPPAARARPAPGARARQTRGALIDAGQKLFALHPVDAVSIDDIVAAAAVAKGSFYNHFDDKDALLHEIVSDIRSGIEAIVARVNAEESDPARRVVRAICVYGGYVMNAPEHGQILIRDNRNGQFHGWESMNAGAIADIGAGLSSGRFSVPTVEAGTLFVLGAAIGIVVRCTGETDVASAVAIGQQLSMMLLRGLGLPYAEAELAAAQAADEIIRRRAFEA